MPPTRKCGVESCASSLLTYCTGDGLHDVRRAAGCPASHRLALRMSLQCSDRSHGQRQTTVDFATNFLSRSRRGLAPSARSWSGSPQATAQPSACPSLERLTASAPPASTRPPPDRWRAQRRVTECITRRSWHHGVSPVDETSASVADTMPIRVPTPQEVVDLSHACKLTLITILLE